MDQSTKFVWAYMIKNGVVTDGEWNQYFGNFEPLFRTPGSLNFSQYEIKQSDFLNKIKTIHVDWSKTKNPVSLYGYVFEGTENEASMAETLLGTLVLLDGSEYKIGMANERTGFSDYLMSISEFASDPQIVKDILGE